MAADEIYYDPFDFEIDADPHPAWRRMRDEAPLYRNDKYDFWALSRFEDVELGLQDWRTYSSAKGTLLELIKSGWQPPAGVFIFEDPPLHDVHRKLLSRVFTPRRMSAIEPLIRSYCARSLDPLVGSGGFDFVADLGSQMPMRVIGMLLGIPEEDQEAIRDGVDESLKLKEGEMPPPPGDSDSLKAFGQDAFGEYITWRRKHPTDDLMTELLEATFRIVVLVLPLLSGLTLQLSALMTVDFRTDLAGFPFTAGTGGSEPDCVLGLGFTARSRRWGHPSSRHARRE
jgi:cytochrome P450